MSIVNQEQVKIVRWTRELPEEPGLYITLDPETGKMGFQTHGPEQDIPPDTDVPILTFKGLLYGPIPDPPL